MDKTQVNPWSWQDRAGFSQAWRVDEPRSIIFVAGQAPVSGDGQLVGQDDFEAQVRQTFENLQTVLQQAGAAFDAVVKVTVYLTDVSQIREFARIRDEFIAGPPPASTVVGVTALALPGMMIEIEAIAVI